MKFSEELAAFPIYLDPQRLGEIRKIKNLAARAHVVLCRAQDILDEAKNLLSRLAGDPDWRQKIVPLGILGKMTDKSIADTFGVKSKDVLELRRQNGIPIFDEEAAFDDALKMADAELGGLYDD